MRSAQHLALPLFLSSLLQAACSAPHPKEHGQSSEPAADPAPLVEWAPHPDWASLSPEEFETLALESLPDGIRVQPTAAALAILEEALARQDESSVRAAVLLARTGSPEAAELLLTRLERRVLGPERISDAGDFLAAAALEHLPTPERARARLNALSVGPLPHPDLEVRVECAARALELGDDSPIPFLLKVLRIGTPGGLQDERDFEVSATTAWARSRAALSLSKRAGIPMQYNPDAPLADRDREAERLARSLQAE